MILERKLVFPSSLELSKEARDLIDKLLLTDPYERIGAGKEGTSNDISALKAHPFFKDIDFT